MGPPDPADGGGTWSRGRGMPVARTPGMFPGCLDLKIGYAQPIDQRKIRPPDLQQTGPLSPQIKRGRCLWHHSDPLRSAEIGDQPIYCSAFRMGTLVPPCPFSCAIDHTSGANAPFCDGWHKLDPARGRETPRMCSPLARPCHGGRSGLHRRAIGPGSEAADIPLTLVRVKIGYVASVPQRLTDGAKQTLPSEATTFCAPAKSEMGLRTVPQSPARTAGCSGCATGSGWHSRDA
jgi:hypothetical protein